jgi:anti-sigma factor RsiW
MTGQPPRSMGDALRDALPTYEAPASLHAWARAQASLAMNASPRGGAPRFVRRFAYAAALIFAAAIGWTGHGILEHGAMSTDGESALVPALVDAHVRSLMAEHLVDVKSSDHHTVKPWFAGKITFAPHVPELQTQGFPLLGGRVEYLAGHTSAALVYGRGPHTINLFIWPAAATDHAAPKSSRDGYSLVHWTEGGLSYWAVSDAAAPELDAFAHAFRLAAAQ